ncbi:LysR substrate-binding domain-containing protein [Bacillus licheniformis]|nr:LysR substrate-binding domain-containing protein [Bacillus licheniformis]
MPSLLFDLQKEYPELELKAVIGNTEEIVQSVRLYKVDIGLIEGQTNEKSFLYTPLCRTNYSSLLQAIIRLRPNRT